MSADDDKKVRPTARPEAPTLKEHVTAPTVPDGQAARVVRDRKQEREAVPRAPLDLDETPPGKGRRP